MDGSSETGKLALRLLSLVMDAEAVMQGGQVGAQRLQLCLNVAHLLQAVRPEGQGILLAPGAAVIPLQVIPAGKQVGQFHVQHCFLVVEGGIERVKTRPGLGQFFADGAQGVFGGNAERRVALFVEMALHQRITQAQMADLFVQYVVGFCQRRQGRGLGPDAVNPVPSASVSVMLPVSVG